MQQGLTGEYYQLDDASGTFCFPYRGQLQESCLSHVILSAASMAELGNSSVNLHRLHAQYPLIVGNADPRSRGSLPPPRGDYPQRPFKRVVLLGISNNIQPSSLSSEAARQESCDLSQQPLRLIRVLYVSYHYKTVVTLIHPDII
ncbi:hypothetical protein EIP91_005403 [Steccherinum ochraceum]|uniref:Uncharacterized protein n=1 Tax=Steccherinum ochraceum TaxID=92696 RepID=A0A4R0R7F7_9APHY|nr:hypothetical protein EIP91_005403 [Steccherinum ochraceum]